MVVAVCHFLATFEPLCHTGGGRRAVERFGHPPFGAGSCRREPDLESRFPSISAVCRGRLFAPRLAVGDRVIYLAKKLPYPRRPDAQWRFVAAVEVVMRFDSHSNAAAWYRSKGLPLPSNCMVEGNPPLPLDHTAFPNLDLGKWDFGYRIRTTANGAFLVCRPLFCELHDPPAITETDLTNVFGRVPVTRNPPKITPGQFGALLALAVERRVAIPPDH